MSCSDRLRTGFAVLFTLAMSHAHAVDLGRYGPVYEIAEPDFIEEMTAKAETALKDGTWKRIEGEVKRRVVERLKNPDPVGGLTVATERRSWLHDPSIILSQSLTDADGHVIYPAGTRINPLDTVSLSRPILFFDGRDDEQVAWAEKAGKRYEQAITPVLVAGSWQDLGIQWGQQVYFDQRGTMTGQLGIRAVPAIVTQEGRFLRVIEGFEEVRP